MPSHDFDSRNRLNRRHILKSGAVVGAAAATTLAGVTTVLANAQGTTPAASPAATGKAKNIIFMMGDGMGQAHRDFGQWVTTGGYTPLVMDTLPVLGFQGTNSVTPDAKSMITDSAASATAFATGFKTFNGAIGVDAAGNTLTNLAELAKAAGKSVGLVTTSQVTDASPAAFAAHVDDRDKQSEIAKQFITDNKIDVILGGGEDRWLPAGTPGAFPDNPPEDTEEASSSDQGNLIEQAQSQGYEYVHDAAGLAAAKGPLLLGLFANEEMFQQQPEGEGDIYDPVVSLAEMTAKAIEILSVNPNGFLLFVEEEAVDEFSHANNATYALKGVQELDKTVAEVLDWTAATNDTLVIVTADHECGGLTLQSIGDDPIEGADGPFTVAGSGYTFQVVWGTMGHTGVKVPLTATGPGSEAFIGYYEDTHIFVKIAEAAGFPIPEGAGGAITPGVPASSATPAASPAATPAS